MLLRNLLALSLVTLVAGLEGCTESERPRPRRKVRAAPPAAERPPVQPPPVLAAPKDDPKLVVKAGAWFDIGPEGQRSIRDVAVDPKTGRVLAAAAAGAGKGGVLATKNGTDGGASWAPIHDGGTCSKVRADGHGKIYALCGDGLLVTEDEGLTWTSLPLPKGRGDAASAFVIAEHVEISPKRPERIYIGAKGGVKTDGLYWTEDAGETWSSIASVVDARADGSTSEGDPAQRVYGLAIHPANPDLMVASFMFGLYVSEDGGKTFTEQAAYKPGEGAWPKSYGKAVRTHSASGIFFDSADSRTLVARRGDRVVVTRDGGATWTETVVASDDLGDTLRVHALMAHPNVSGVLYAHTGDVLHVSADFGATWAPVVLGTIPDFAATVFAGWTTPVSAAETGYTSLQFQAFDQDEVAPFLVLPATGRILAGAAEGFLQLVGVPGS